LNIARDARLYSIASRGGAGDDCALEKRNVRLMDSTHADKATMRERSSMRVAAANDDGAEWHARRFRCRPAQSL
jgi:hypothetical protein